MTHDDDLRKLAELIDKLNEKMDRTVQAVIALGEVVRVEGEEQAWRDDKMLKMIQKSQAEQKRHTEKIEAALRARDELAQILVDELRNMGPALAHASEQFTMIAQRLSEEILTAKKKRQVATA